MARTDLSRLLLLLLGISHLICLRAIPVTRTATLMQGTETPRIVGDSHMLARKEKASSEEGIMTEKMDVKFSSEMGAEVKMEKGLEGRTVKGRMDVELEDYPGSGANNRHTPRAQIGRCYDC